MPDVVLLHGIQSSASTWWRVRPDLEALGVSVAAPDLPGHGGRPSGDRSVEALAGAVAAGLDGPALIVGHSLGALVALDLERRRPDLVRALVLEDPPSLGDGRRPIDVAGDVTAAAEEARRDPEGLLTRLLGENPLWARQDAQHAVANRAVVDDVAAMRLLDHEGWDLAALVRAARVPVTVLAASGPGSALTPPDRAAVLAAATHAVEVPSGHAVHRDRPGVWVAVVLDALRSAGSLPSRPGRPEA